MNVSAVIPAHDEADRIVATITALRTVRSIDQVVVVDDGSTDDTSARASNAGARVIRSARNRGKGHALAAGVAACRGDVLVFVDADLGSTAEGIGALVEPVLAGEVDIAIAAPPPGAPSGFGLVEGFARWVVRASTGMQTTRPLSGQRALRREVLEHVRWPVGGFGVEVSVTIDAIRAGYRVREIPMLVEHRRTGRDLAGFAHRARQGLAVLMVSLRSGVRFHRR